MRDEEVDLTVLQGVHPVAERQLEHLDGARGIGGLEGVDDGEQAGLDRGGVVRAEPNGAADVVVGRVCPAQASVSSPYAAPMSSRKLSPAAVSDTRRLVRWNS